MVEGTLDVYQKVISSLLPTPTKSHYTFNLRDISRVMQGFLMMHPQQLGTGAAGKEKYTRLWTNEVCVVMVGSMAYDREYNTVVFYVYVCVRGSMAYDM